MNVVDIIDAIRPVLKALGITGELDVCFERSRALSWMGEPSDGDKVVRIFVTDMKEDDSFASGGVLPVSKPYLVGGDRHWLRNSASLAALEGK